jgi:subtilisin family serine protease
MQRAAQKARIATVLAIVFAVLSLAGPADSTTLTSHADGHAADRLLVKFKANTRTADVGRALKSARATEISTIRDLGVRVVSVSPERLDAALTTLRRSRQVLFAEYDGIARAADTLPNDPWWPNEWAQVKTKAPKAWDSTTGAASTVVAVLDTGIDAAQPDLQGALVAGRDVVNGDAAPDDDHGHGTMVAGIVGARSNNGLGVASYCWKCSIMPVKVLGADGLGSFSNVAGGITWSVDHGARVINMSLGGTTASNTLAQAVKYAHDHGVVLVAAAGNNGSATPTYPAAYPEVIGVAGSDGTDALYSWSNRGSWVKVAAPGSNMTTARGGAYTGFAGTSSASPVVAGIAGLAVSYAPERSNVEIEQAIESSAVAIAAGSVQYGRVDASATLLSLGAAPAAPPSGSAPVSVAAPAISGTAGESQTLSASAGSWTGSTPMTYGYQWTRCDSVGAGCSDIIGATGQSYTLAPADVGYAVRAWVTASNAYGTAVSSSAPTGVITPAQPVTSPPSPTSTAMFSGNLNKKQTTRSFTVTLGTGEARAQLSFSKANSLTLTLVGPDGSTIGSASGASIIELVRSVPAGAYQYIISGPNGTNAAFSLTVTYATP